MRPETSIDVIQTAGIIFMAILLAYVVVRLERAINTGAEKLRLVASHHQATLDSLNKLWTRITELEGRMGVRDADFVPTPVLRKALKRIETLEHEVIHEGASIDN
jgi:hypothetical protein